MHYFNSKSKSVFKVILILNKLLFNIIKHYFCKVALLSLLNITYKGNITLKVVLIRVKFMFIGKLSDHRSKEFMVISC